MGFIEAVSSVFAGYFRFSGRAPRSEFWWFFLFEMIAISVLVFVDVRMAMGVYAATGSEAAVMAISPFDFMVVYYFVLSFVPRMAVTVRRLHDVGLSGWFYLLYFVPVVGGLVVFFLTLLPSEGVDNTYGPRPFRPVGGSPAQKAARAKRTHDPMQGYAVLDRVNAPVTPEMQAARKAQIRALYESRVLGKGSAVAE